MIEQNTAMILGAALSGGDPMLMAQMIVDAQEDTTENAESEGGPLTRDQRP